MSRIQSTVFNQWASHMIIASFPCCLSIATSHSATFAKFSSSCCQRKVSTRSLLAEDYNMDGTKIKVFFPYVASNFEVIPSEEYVYSGGGASAFVSGFGAVPIGCGVCFFPFSPPFSLFLPFLCHHWRKSLSILSIYALRRSRAQRGWHMNLVCGSHQLYVVVESFW